MPNSEPSGAYASPGGEPKTQLSVIALLDVLGFTQQMREAHIRGQSDALLQRIAGLIDDWYGRTGVLRDRAAAEENRQRLWEVKAFTDNVVLAHPIRSDPEGEFELGSLFSDIALLQLGFAERGLFLRGGIAAGDLYVDDSLVYGVAVIDAHDAEKSAGTPRVVLAQSAIKYVQTHLRYYKSIADAPHNRDLLIDEDGRWVVDYLVSAWPDRTEPPLFDWLEKHRDAVSRKLREFAADDKISTKYRWTARYHNYSCGRIPGGEDYLLDETLRPFAARRLQDDPELRGRRGEVQT